MINDNMFNEIKFGAESTELIKSGIDKLANAVKITLGPRGKNVIISNPYGYPHITKDGATVASSITLENQTENIGATLIKDVAIRTAKEAGDGSTTATIYAQSIFNHLLVHCNEPMTTAKDKMINILDDFKTKLYDEATVATREKAIEVATVSANNDKYLGEFIYNVYETVGPNGPISIINSQSINTTVKYTNGIKLNSGLISTNFISNKEKGLFEGEDVECRIITHSIDAIKDISKYITNDKPKLFIVKSIDEYVLNTLIYNVSKNKLKLAIIRMPGYGSSKDMYHKAIIEKIGEFAIIDKVTCSMSECVLEFDGAINCDDQMEKIKFEIDNYNDNELQTYDIETLREIYNIYYGKSAIIYIGGYSEGEIKEKKDRADDALMAIKSTYEAGWIYGSCLTMCKIAQKWIEEKKGSDVYYESVIHALSEPLNIMCKNCGIKLENVLDIMIDTGFTSLMNFKSLEIENVNETKIIEPAKISISALTNAINIVILLLSTHCTIEYK